MVIPLLLRRARKRPSRFRSRTWQRRRILRGVLLPASLLAFLGLWLLDTDTLNSAWLRLQPDTAETVNPGLLSVVDGDTVRLAGERIRLTGFDAPETYRAECVAERAQGEAATARLRELIGQASHATLTYLPRQDQYGRDLARLSLDGHNVADIMVREGLARRYGGGQRRPWC